MAAHAMAHMLTSVSNGLLDFSCRAARRLGAEGQLTRAPRPLCLAGHSGACQGKGGVVVCAEGVPVRTPIGDLHQPSLDRLQAAEQLSTCVSYGLPCD